MTILRNLIVCALASAACANDLSASSTMILGELGTAEHMVQGELRGHPQIMQEEMQLLHSAEAAVRHGHAKAPKSLASELLQQESASTQGLAIGTGMILSELSTAEGMLQNELRGHPKILQEEMNLLHSAEDATRHVVAPRPAFLQHTASASEGETMGTGKVLGELGEVEKMAQKELAGHPRELQAEEGALQQAEQAAKALNNPKLGAFLAVAQKSQAGNSQKVQVSVAELQQQRSRSMTSAMQEERAYGTAEQKLTKEDEKLLSDFGRIETSIAQTFAGKDSKAVKTAMRAGELLDKAHDEQQQVTKLDASEATDATKKADKLAAALAQTDSKSKAKQVQQAYTTGMSKLVKDEQSALSEFAGLKTAVAQAFAGKDSKAVEKAMQVGELLDQAREGQKQVAERDAKDEADAKRLFQEVSQHEQLPAKKAFLQKQGRSSTSVSHALRMQSLAAREQGIVHLTEKAEDAITRELAKDGRHEAMAAEHEVISMMEQARKAEEAAFVATARAAKNAGIQK